jgi:hypothetical protein
MNLLHRHHLKATLWILFNPSSLFCPTFSQSAVALRLQVPHFSRIHSLPARSWSSLQATTKDSRENIDNSNSDNRNNMIVRVRSNIGTAKLTIEDEEIATESTIRTGILEELRRKTANTTYKLTQDLSFDPAGVRRIHRSKTLSEQGIRHGCMVYCRVEEEEEEIPKNDPNNFRPNDQTSIGNNDNVVSSENNSDKDKNSEIMAGKKEAITKKKDDVIDLVESSDEEETICIGKTDNDNGNDDDDDDDVQVISPKKIESIRRKNTADNNNNATSKARKRQRQRSATTDGQQQHSSSTKSVASENYPNFQIASYNVWFGPPDADAKQVFPRERMEGIVESLKVACQAREREAGERGETTSCPLLFVGLQELTPNLVQYLQPRFQNMGYRLCTQPLGGFGPSYGIGIAVPEDLVVLERQFVPYRNSIQGRGFLFVRTPKILFVTTHLESWCGPKFTGTQEREVQIVEAADYCKTQLQLRSFDGLELAVIAGDLNWDDERKRKQSEAPNRNLLSILPNWWKDAGTPFDYTYDAKENPMLNGSLRRRLDRCIYLSASRDSDPQNNYKSTDLQKIGKESIPNLVWNKKNSYNDTIKKMAVNPSDHFGIMIPFSKKIV